MKTSALAAAFALAMVTPNRGLASQLQDIAWNDSNITALRALSRADIESLVNQLSGGDLIRYIVGQSLWKDLAGNGQCELVVTLDVSGRAFFDNLAVYQRDTSGRITTQWFKGETAVGKLDGVVRDLNGDRRDELILPEVFPPTAYGADVIKAVWPGVYELQDGRYFQADKQFLNYYDSEVLPDLDRDIAEARTRMAAEPQYHRRLFALTMERDKILRVLGRNPTAGLDDARAWVKSNDPNLVRAGLGVLQDIGGHDGEVKAAKEALSRTIAQQRAAHRGG